MGSWLDTAGASLLFGAVVLIVVGLNAMLMSTANQDNFRSVAHEQVSGVDTLAGLSAIMTEDLLNAGYGSASAFRVADSNRVTLLGDVDHSGVAVSVKWYLSAGTPPAATNPKSRILLLR